MPIAGRILSGERRTGFIAVSGSKRASLSGSTSNPIPAATVYGPGVGGIQLANTTLGGPNGTGLLDVMFGWRANVTDTIASMRFYYQSTAAGSGYGGGTGGTWDLKLYAVDATGNPTGAAIATQSVSAQSTNSPGRLMTCGTGWDVTAGQRYAFVFTLTDASPLTNYWAPNFWQQPSTSPTFDAAHTMGPLWPDADLFHKYKQNGTWVLRTGYLPILDITYNGGYHQGMSYGEAVYGSLSYFGKVNGSNEMVRARFVPASSITVAGAYWRATKVTGTTQPLVITLRDSSDTLLDTISVAAADVPSAAAPTTGSSTTDLGKDAAWVGGSFASPVALSSGSEYRLRLSSVGGTYWTHLMRHMTSYGYDRSVSWGDAGASEKTTDGSTWSSVKAESDFQFALILQ